MGIPITEKARSILLNNHERLSRDFITEHVVSYLVQMFAITPTDMSDILAEKTERQKSAALLNLVLMKGQSAYNALYSAFMEQYSWLAPILYDGVTRDGYDSDDDMTYSTSEIQTILNRGGVPARPRVYIDRPEVIQRIRSSLSRLKESPGYVVVHGMGGVGKSVLAAEAFRNSTVLKDYFPGGVIWASIGKVDIEELLIKAQNLCARLDKDHQRSPPRNMEEARDRLRSILHEQFPCCLLILDDVWSLKVVQGFDVQARVLITTRDKSVTDPVSGLVLEVPLGDEGFSEAQSLHFLASWAKQDVTSLPPEAKSIAQDSKGSPLILSIFGGLISDNPHRWEFYASKLKARNYSRLRKASTYEYHSVDEAIGTSVHELPESLQEMYKDFAVFNPGTKIPGKVLSIYWNKPVEDVEEEIIPLVNKSLIRQEWETTLGCMVYTIHDLLMDFLKHLVADKKPLHQRLARRYADHCKNQYETLEDDQYIYWNFAMHAAEGEVYDILQPLLCGWPWTVQKIEVAGPASVLNDLIRYSDMLSNSDKRMANQIRSFISVNAHLLIQRPPPNMLQLALNSEEKSPLYQMALKLIKQSKQGMYLTWVNRNNETNSLQLASQVHQGIAHCAEFSPEGGSIISCGEDNTIKIINSSTAQVERTFREHEDDVTWCCFSPEGDLVMSCSVIGEVIIWETMSGDVIKSINVGNSDAINMCQFSHNGSHFGYCSLSGNVGVGSLSDFQTKTYMVCNAGITCMSFSPDDEKIIVGAYDATSRVVMAHSGDEVVSYTKHKFHIVWCDFFPSGKRAASADAGEVHVWDPLSGECEEKVGVKGAYILRCAISNHGSLLAGALSDCTVWLWECQGMTAVAVHHGHTSWVYSVAFDPSDEMLVTAADDGTIMVWKAVTESFAKSAMLLRKFAVHFKPDSSVEFVCAADRHCQCLVIKGDQVTVVAKEESKITCMSLDQSGDRGAYGCSDGTLVVYKPRAGEILERLKNHDKGVIRCEVSKDGKTIISCSEDNTLAVRSEGQDVVILRGHTSPVNYCHLLKSNKSLLSAGHDGFIRLWDVRTAKSEGAVQAHSDWVLSCDVSQDESMVVSTSVDCSVKIWFLQGLKLLHSLTEHEDLVRSCRLSQDGSLLATGDDSGLICTWNVRTGSLIGRCSKHFSWVTYLHFSPDNKMLVSVGENIRWWGVDGSRIQSFVIKGSYLRQIETDPTFSTFVSIDSAGTLYVLSKLNREDIPTIPDVIYV